MIKVQDLVVGDVYRDDIISELFYVILQLDPVLGTPYVNVQYAGNTLSHTWEKGTVYLDRGDNWISSTRSTYTEMYKEAMYIPDFISDLYKEDKRLPCLVWRTVGKSQFLTLTDSPQPGDIIAKF